MHRAKGGADTDQPPALQCVLWAAAMQQQGQHDRHAHGCRSHIWAAAAPEGSHPLSHYSLRSTRTWQHDKGKCIAHVDHMAGYEARAWLSLTYECPVCWSCKVVCAPFLLPCVYANLAMLAVTWAA